MKSKLFIKGPRQRRALKALLVHNQGIPCKDLGPIIGALNPWQTIMELRLLGFHGGIVTERFSTQDRDGKICRPGKYRLLPNYHELAEDALRQSAAGPGATEPAAKGTKYNRKCTKVEGKCKC